jgi:hypothetical protein
VNIYNQQDHQALYAIFNEQAKVKINYQQLKNQLKNLFYLFGEIEESAFISAGELHTDATSCRSMGFNSLVLTTRPLLFSQFPHQTLTYQRLSF